jgi:F-type H+-transporting ATPase subunit b
MDQTLKQLGELLLGAIPTVVFLVLLYFFYRLLVHKPLAKVLEERHNLTEGAVQRARADIAAAEAKTAEYENKLREASLAVFKAQEERRQLVVSAREAAVAEARAKAQQQVNAAKAALEQDRAVAQSQLQGEAERLASDVIRTVLRPMSLRPSSSSSGASPAGGGR